MNKITTQIKFIGLSLSVIAIALIVLTLNLNQKSKNDANVVNISGKERMLTQKMAKELFLGQGKSEEFEAAKKEFVANLYSLTNGSEKNGITPPPSKKIQDMLTLIKQKSDEFLILSGGIQDGHKDDALMKRVYTLNNELLGIIDDTVREYTIEFEAKRERLETLQYAGGVAMLFAVLISIYLTKKIEIKFDRFLSETKEIGSLHCEEMNESDNETTASYGELDQAKNELKTFIARVEKVVSKAEAALNESQNAIAELESSTKIMDARLHNDTLDENTRKEMESYVDKSEDLTISSLEDIAGTKAMLQKFRTTLAEINGKIA